MNSIAYMTIDLCYPKGCLFYTTDKDFDPNVKFVGTWEKIEEGRFIEATVREAELGTTREAGLPNITGITHIAANGICYFNPETYTGCFYSSDKQIQLNQFNATGSKDRDTALNFDASRSSTIYGSSATVQPKSYLCYIWHRTN